MKVVLLLQRGRTPSMSKCEGVSRRLTTLQGLTTSWGSHKDCCGFSGKIQRILLCVCCSISIASDFTRIAKSDSHHPL